MITMLRSRLRRSLLPCPPRTASSRTSRDIAFKEGHAKVRPNHVPFFPASSFAQRSASPLPPIAADAIEMGVDDAVHDETVSRYFPRYNNVFTVNAPCLFISLTPVRREVRARTPEATGRSVAPMFSRGSATEFPRPDRVVSIRPDRCSTQNRRNTLLINKRAALLPLPPYAALDLFRIDSSFRYVYTNTPIGIHERRSRKGAVTRDVIRTYRCPHDNPDASELSIPKKLRANLR